MSKPVMPTRARHLDVMLSGAKHLVARDSSIACGDLGMTLRKSSVWLATMCLMALLVAEPVRADQVMALGVNYTSARFLKIEDGKIHFRSSDGAIHQEWISDLGLLIVERGGMFDDFNQAERQLAAGEPEKAALRYERALRLSDDAWSELISTRLLICYDRTGQFDKTAANFVRIARGRATGPAVAARMFPKTPPTKRDAKFARAIENLEAGVGAETGDAQRVVLEALRFEWLREIGDTRANRIARVLPTMPVPEPIRTNALYAILTRAIGVWLEKDPTPGAMQAIDAAIRDCPAESLPDLLLLKGEALAKSARTREEMIRASWPYMRVAIHMADDSRAADGLFGAALLMQRMTRNDLATSLVDECLAHPHISNETKTKAGTLRRDLAAASTNP